MSTGNSIQGTFGVSIAPLQRDFAQAEQAAKTTAAKVSAALNNIQPARGGGRSMLATEAFAPVEAARRNAVLERIRRNSGAGFAPAPPGKYPAPGEQEGNGMFGATGRGLAGLGLLTAVHKLAAVYTEAAQKAYDLRVENDKLLQPLSGTTGIDELRQRIVSIAKAEDDASKQRRIDTGSFLGMNVKAGQLFLNKLNGWGTFAEQLGQEDKDRAGMRKRSTEALELMGTKQKELNEAEREGQQGSERQSALLKAQIAHREKLNVLAKLETSGGSNVSAARDAENERFGLETGSINRRSNLRALEQTMQSRIGGFATGNLPPALQHIAALQERMKFLRQKFTTGSDEDKVDTGIEMGRTDTELQRAQFAERATPWDQRAAAQRQQQKFQSFIAAQSPSNPNAYLSHPDAYKRRDILGNKLDEAGNIAEGNAGSGDQTVTGILDDIRNTLNNLVGDE